MPDGGQAGALPPEGDLLHEADAIRVLGFSPDGERLAYLEGKQKTALTGGDLWVWDFSQSSPTLIEKAVRADTVFFVRGGTGLVYLQSPQNVGLFDDAGTFRYYDLMSDSASTLGEYTPSRSIVVSPNGNQVAFSNDYGKTFGDIGGPIELHDLASGSTLELAADYFNSAPIFSADGRWLAMHDSLSNVELWDLEHSRRTSVGFSSDVPMFSAKSNKLVFIAGESLIVHDLASGTSTTAARDADAATMSPLVNYVAYRATAASGKAADLKLCSLDSSPCTKIGAGNLGPFSPDGARLALRIAVPGAVDLHLRDLGTQTDALIAQKLSGVPYFSSDASKMVFMSNAVNVRSATLSLWTPSSGASTISTVAAGFASGENPFFADDQTVLFLSHADANGVVRTTGLADLYAADAGNLTPVALGQNVSALVYPSPDRECLVFHANYDSASQVGALTAIDLSTRPFPSPTILDRDVAWDVAVSAERAAYVVGGSLYASRLPCSSR